MSIGRIDELPLRVYLKIGREEDPETGMEFLAAVLMESPPDGGWESDCEYFRHVPRVHAKGGGLPGGRRCGHVDGRRYVHDDRCLMGTSSAPNDLGGLILNVASMVNAYIDGRGCRGQE
jgi:hypothetical protein